MTKEESTAKEKEKEKEKKGHGLMWKTPRAIKTWETVTHEESAHARWADLFYDLLFVGVAFRTGHLLEHLLAHGRMEGAVLTPFKSFTYCSHAGSRHLISTRVLTSQIQCIRFWMLLNSLVWGLPLSILKKQRHFSSLPPCSTA